MQNWNFFKEQKRNSSSRAIYLAMYEHLGSKLSVKYISSNRTKKTDDVCCTKNPSGLIIKFGILDFFKFRMCLGIYIFFLKKDTSQA